MGITKFQVCQTIWTLVQLGTGKTQIPEDSILDSNPKQFLSGFAPITAQKLIEIGFSKT